RGVVFAPYARDAVARGLRAPVCRGRLVRAALAGDVVLRTWQLAAADVAEQLFEDGQLAAAGRGFATLHGDLAAVFQPQGAHVGDLFVALGEGDFRDGPLRHLRLVVGVALRRLGQ